MITTIKKMFRKKDESSKRKKSEFKVIINRKQRTVVITEDSIKFPLAPIDDTLDLAAILNNHQKVEEGFKFALSDEVALYPSQKAKKEKSNFQTVKNIREYFTEIGIPIKKFVRKESYC